MIIAAFIVGCFFGALLMAFAVIAGYDRREDK